MRRILLRVWMLQPLWLYHGPRWLRALSAWWLPHYATVAIWLDDGPYETSVRRAGRSAKPRTDEEKA